MFHEYRDTITVLKGENKHFANIFDKHNELDERIQNITSGREHVDDFELETLKKEKLRLKDEVFSIITEYRKNHS